MSYERYLPEGHEPFAKPIAHIYADAMEELAKPVPSVPLKEFPQFTQMTGGFRPFEYSILCGGTGTGKTTLCSNISRDLTGQRVPHFIASVETGHTDFVKRTMSAFVGKDWNTGDAIPLSALKDFHVRFGHYFQHEHSWLSLYDNRISVETLLADLSWMIKHKGIKLAIIDNLNFLMEVTRAQDQNIEMDRVTHELIMFCKVAPIHILMVMHPKKTEDQRVEGVFDVKGSSGAVQEAHNVLCWNKPHPDLIKAGVATEFDRELKIAKMRRRGKYVGKRLILRAKDYSSYYEGDIL